MKYIITLVSIFLVTTIAWGQSAKQVRWTYVAKKIADKTYEVHMTANMNGNWHLYAQDAGVEGPVPTTFTFNNNPLIVLTGKPKEIGKLVTKKEDAWGKDAVVNYYEKTVNFVQVVKLKSNIKTNVTGKVEFIVCDDRLCLPPSEVEFNVNVGG